VFTLFVVPCIYTLLAGAHKPVTTEDGFEVAMAPVV